MENRAESFLRLVRRSQRGKLKIYLGYCAGVGKTYQMLLEGQRLGKMESTSWSGWWRPTAGRKRNACCRGWT